MTECTIVVGGQRYRVVGRAAAVVALVAANQESVNDIVTGHLQIDMTPKRIKLSATRSFESIQLGELVSK